MTEKYYQVYLNNNIFMNDASDGYFEGGFANQAIDGSVYDDDKLNFKKKGKVLKKAEGIKGLFGIYTEEEGYVPLERVLIIGFEKDSKIYDLITGLEIPFASKEEAKQYDFITYHKLENVTEFRVAQEIEKFNDCPQNILAYKARMSAVKKESERIHSESLESVQKNDDTLIRSRKIIEDFKKRNLEI